MADIYIGDRKVNEIYVGTKRVYAVDSEESHLVCKYPFVVSNNSGAYTCLLFQYTSLDFTSECYARLTTKNKSTGSPVIMFCKPDLNIWAFGIDLLSKSTDTTQSSVRTWVNDKLVNSITIDSSLWHHFAITHKSNGDCVLFIDGVKSATYTANIDKTQVSRFYITNESESNRNIAEVSSFKFYDNIRYESNFMPPTREY